MSRCIPATFAAVRRLSIAALLATTMFAHARMPPPIPTTVSVGAGQAYTSLTNPGGLFDAINAGGIAGDTTVLVTSDLVETGAVALLPIANTAASITVRPDAASERLIAGAASNGLIQLAGADNVVFDGRFAGGGRFLRFRNTAAAPTFLLTDGARSDRLFAIVVEGGDPSATGGTIVFGATSSLGNDFNVIDGCLVRDRSDAPGVPANAIHSTGAPNTLNQVVRNEIANFSATGIRVAADGGGTWLVDSNSIYATAPRTTPLTGIALLAPAAHIVAGNYIGGSAANAGGSFLSTSAPFRGIDVFASPTATPASVQGNVVRNVRSTSTAFTPSYGIFIESGRADVGTTAANFVGSADFTQRFEVNGDSYGIRVTSSSVVDLRNNRVLNMVTAPNVPAGEFYFGIAVQGTGGAHVVANNGVSNLLDGSTPDVAGAFDTRTIGLFVNATGVQTVRNNLIANVASTSTVAPTAQNNRVWGIVLSGTAAGTLLSGNRVVGLTAASAGAVARADVVTGIQLQTQANVVATNNAIAFDGGGAADRALTGILELNPAGTASSWAFNSVHVSGTGSATGANNTFAFLRLGLATVSLRDNIFASTRTGGNGLHIALANGAASSAGWSATASDYNLVSTADPLQLTQWLGNGSMSLTAFRNATGGDAHSIEAAPGFASPTDLHIAPGSAADNAGATFGGVTLDFDGDARSTLAPDIGFDEVNRAPTIASPPLTVRAGDPGIVRPIAVASDADQPPLTLTASVDGGGAATRNGVAINAPSLDPASNVNAGVDANCAATNASFSLGVTDANGALAQSTLDVTVTPNLAPTLTYAARSARYGESLAVNPASGPTDSGGIASIVVQSPGTYAGGIAVDAAGVVSLTNAAPVGTHTIVVRATDNCGATTDAPISLTVQRAQTTIAITGDSPDPSLPGQPVLVQWQLTPVAPGAGTPTGSVVVANELGDRTCSAPVATGQCSIVLDQPGAQHLFATYGGDANFVQTESVTPHIVGAATDLRITKASNLAQINAGLVQYTIVATNLGPSAVTGATVADDLPAILTNVTWTCTSAGGGSCAASGSGDIVQPVNLPVGATATFAITANIATNPLPPSLSNTATITAPASVPDSNPANDTATVTDGLLIFRNGFEDGGLRLVATSLAMPSPGELLVQPLDRDAVQAAAIDEHARDVALFTIGDELVLVSARRIAGAIELRTLQRDRGGLWSGNAWIRLPVAARPAISWSRQGDRLRVELDGRL